MSSNPLYIVSYYIKWVTTSLTHSNMVTQNTVHTVKGSCFTSTVTSNLRLFFPFFFTRAQRVMSYRLIRLPWACASGSSGDPALIIIILVESELIVD